jgi:hypothetical protein
MHDKEATMNHQEEEGENPEGWQTDPEPEGEGENHDWTRITRTRTYHPIGWHPYPYHHDKEATMNHQKEEENHQEEEENHEGDEENHEGDKENH